MCPNGIYILGKRQMCSSYQRCTCSIHLLTGSLINKSLMEQNNRQYSTRTILKIVDAEFE